MVELHVHTLFSLQLMVFSYFPAACPAHSWQDQKSLSSKVNWAGFEADRGFGRIRALTNRTNAKAAGSLSIADQSMFQDMELSRTCVSLRRNAQQIVSEWALLYYLCWFTCLWTTYFLKEPFCLLFYFWGTLPLLSCWMPSVRLSHLWQVPLSLFVKSVFSREPFACVEFKGGLFRFLGVYFSAVGCICLKAAFRKGLAICFGETLLSSSWQMDNTSNKIQ